jgi:hypothetical protein
VVTWWAGLRGCRKLSFADEVMLCYCRRVRWVERSKQVLTLCKMGDEDRRVANSLGREQVGLMGQSSVNDQSRQVLIEQGKAELELDKMGMSLEI